VLRLLRPADGLRPLPSHWRYLAKPYPGDALLRMLQEMLADIPPKAPTSAPSAPPS